MNRTLACPDTETYRGVQNGQTYRRTLVRCKHGRFDGVRMDELARLKRGKHECALCHFRLQREDVQRKSSAGALLSLRQALNVLLKATELLLIDEAQREGGS